MFSDSETPPQPVVSGTRSVFLLLCLMTFSLSQVIHIITLKEILPNEGDYLGLHSRFTVSPFRPSGNSVVLVVLMIHMIPDHLDAHPHFQTLVERLNGSI